MSGVSIELLKGKWIFAAGPLRISIISGKIDVFGWEYKKDDELIIQEFRSAPILALENSKITIQFSEKSYISASDKPLIPDEWKKFAEECLNKKKKPLKIMVIGSVDTGKTGLVTFLANYFLKKKKKIAVIDADTGQQDIAFPTCIGMGFVKKPITHLSEIEMSDAFFIGRTSPAELFDRVLVGLRFLMKRALENHAEIILLDTTGWVFDLGRELKISKILSTEPDMIALLEAENELYHYEATLKEIARGLNVEIRHLPASPVLKARTREERREIRKRLYLKAFVDAKEISLKLHDLSILYGYIGTGKLTKIDELICEEHPEKIIIFSQKDVEADVIKAIEEKFNKKAIVFNPDELKEILVGLIDKNMHFLGLGIVLNYNPETDEIKIYTRAPQDKIAGLIWGLMKITINGEEKAWLKPWQI